MSVTQVSAAVSDNVVTAKLESAVGAYEDSKEAHTVFGLLHYLVDQVIQLRSDLANVQVAVSQIKVSSDMQNETVINTYLQQLKEGKYTSIAAYTSSVKIQEAMATSPIVINSDRSGFALDWLITNGRDLNEFFSKLDGFNYTVPTGYTVDQFVADNNCWNHAKAATFGRYALSASAISNCSTISSRASWVTASVGESGYYLYNVILLGISTNITYDYYNGEGDWYHSAGYKAKDIVGNESVLLDEYTIKGQPSYGRSCSPKKFCSQMYSYRMNDNIANTVTFTYVQL